MLCCQKREKNPEISTEQTDWTDIVNATAAVLGPNMTWEKPYDNNIKMEYMDLDEFLSENNIALPVHGDTAASGPQPCHPAPEYSAYNCSSDGTTPEPLDNQIVPLTPLSHMHSLQDSLPSSIDLKDPSSIDSGSSSSDCSQSIGDLHSISPGNEAFDSSCPGFSEIDVKRAGSSRKSRKQFVPDNMKDDKYWFRRHKNNMAAKRSRDARRMKENQVALRASFLERENSSLHLQVSRLQKESAMLRQRLAKHEKV